MLQLAQHDLGLGLAIADQRRGLGSGVPRRVLRERHAENVGKDRKRVNLEFCEGCLFDRIDLEHAPMRAVDKDGNVEH
jgi:hypothetical protein